MELLSEHWDGVVVVDGRPFRSATSMQTARRIVWSNRADSTGNSVRPTRIGDGSSVMAHVPHWGKRCEDGEEEMSQGKETLE